MITRRIARPLGALAKEQWTCSSCVRPEQHSLTRSTTNDTYQTRASLVQQATQRRSLSATAQRNVTAPRLTLDEQFNKEGVPGLFSAIGYQLGWTSYQEMMITKLNELLAGEPDEHSDAKTLVLKYARDPQYASIFNHASMAWNNHFFYQSLSTSPTRLSDISGGLEASLLQTFGSIDTLKATFLDTAASMFAPGFVWLVYSRDVTHSGTHSPAHASTGGWRILNTYAAGTPFPEAGYRQQGLDMNNHNAQSARSGIASQNLGSFGGHSASGKSQLNLPVGGTSVMPVLCVSTWQHAYIYDYGVSGKRKYLSDWWDAIDWHTVDTRVPGEAKSQANLSQLGRRAY